MRRDLGNELIVAVVAVAVMAFALTFGVIITLSNESTRAGAVLLPTTSIHPADARDDTAG